MGNRKRRSKSEMKRVYFMRRTVAVLILILIIAAIYTRCSKPNENEKVNENNIQTETNTTDPGYVEVDNPQQTVIPDDNEIDDENPDAEGQTDVQTALETNEKHMQEDFQEYGEFRYEEEDHTFYFEFTGDTKDMVINRENSEEFPQFLENFRYDMIKTSETLAETVEPGIKIHVVEPKDDLGTFLLIQDGTLIYDATTE